jgi:hypothetical protein
VPETARPWATTEVSLSDLTPFADWDPVVSTILSLRTYLFEHGAIPTWNYMLCGGRPELSVPFSWAYTWPSLFGYSLPPIHAVIAVWIVMTAVGFFSLRGLLRRWGADSLGANTGACLYAFSGCFAARFEAGHVSIAFFHLVPLLMLLFEIGFARALAGQPMFGAALMTTLGSFLFMSAGLPHALMHFYPAFLLLVAFRVVQTAGARGTTRSLRAAAVPITAHALGLWLAAYKLWPVIRWQLAYPRQRVMFESYSVWEVIRNTLLFVPDYLQPGSQQAWHVYPAWGYNAYVGPVAWLLAAFAAIAVIAKSSRTGGSRDDRRGGGFALLLIAIGIALSLGNDSPLSPASVFRHFPLLDGIRAFNRYQILIVFGVSTLVAHGLSAIAAQRGGRAGSKAIAGALALGALAPVLAQAGLLAWNVPATSKTEILARYPAVDPPEPPQLIGKRWADLRESGHESALLERGYWIGNCHSDLTLPALRLWLPGGVSKPISWPAPDGLGQLGRNSLTLSYASKGEFKGEEEDEGERGEEPVILNLRILESFQFDAPTHTLPDGRTAFYRSDLDGGRLTVTAVYPGPAQGAWATGAGLLACIGFFGLLRTRPAPRREARPES